MKPQTLNNIKTRKPNDQNIMTSNFEIEILDLFRI